MSTLAGQTPSPLGDQPRLRAVGIALFACTAGFAAGVVGLFPTRAVVSILGAEGTDVVRVVSSNFIQVGFGAFAVAYVALRGDAERFVRIRRPTARDIAWILGLYVLTVALGTAADRLLSATWLPHPSPGGDERFRLAAHPALWPFAFVALYLFAAPAEEMVYRGIVHGELRPAFGVPGRVAIGGMLFGLLHLLVGLVTPAVSFAGAVYWGLSAVVPGLLWGYGYERTDNLLVTSTVHAMSWTIPLHAVLPFA